MTTRRNLTLSAALSVAAVMMLSCSSGPTPPQKGTPAFYWTAAQETYATGDYLKTSDHLEALLRSENEFSTKAQPWRLVVTAGLANAFRELADHYELGARANKSNPTPFRRQLSDYRTMFNRHALQFAESFQQFVKTNKDEKITLAFSYPTGSSSALPQLKNVAAGILVPAPELPNIQKRSIERGVLLTACRAAGAEEDVPRAQGLFKSGAVEIPRSTFVLAMATELHNQAQLYAPGKIDQPDRLKTFCNLAIDAVKTLPETKETKEVTSKIQATLKKVKS